MSVEPSSSRDSPRPGAAGLPDPPDPSRDDLDARRALMTSLVAMAALFAITVVAGVWFRGPLVDWSRGFVEIAGGPGIAAGFFIPDAFTIPIPSDAFSTFGIAGGLSFWHVVAWATAGSVAGGCTGWFIGRRLRRTRRMHRFASGRGARVERLVRRHGAWLIALAAVSPLPYSLSAWVAGASRMPLTVFFAVSLLRVVRVGAPLYLIELGLLTFSG